MSPPSGGVPDHGGAGDAVNGRLLLAAVHIVERALALAATEGAGPRDSAAAPLVPDKVRCEASMLLRAATPVADSDQRLPAALARLAAALAEPDPAALSVRLCLHPGLALDLALVPLHLRALGLGDPRLEPLLADLLGSDRLRGPERQPHRELEQLWLHGLWSGEADPESLERVVAASSLAREFDHLAGTTDDAYSLTHAILYASDHGRRRVALPRPAGEIVQDADAILAVALDAGNHDVAAEVLWTWPMLGLPLTPLAGQAGAFLAQVSDALGFLPGPGFDAAVHHALPPSQREAYELRTSYHTTLVHGLLLAAAPGTGAGQRRPAPDRAAGEDSPADTPRVAAIAAHLQPTTSAGAWWSRFAALGPAARDALAPALVTMALRRAAGAADLAAVGHILGLVAGHDLPATPMVRQARVLLRRAMTCATLAGRPVGAR